MPHFGHSDHERRFKKSLEADEDLKDGPDDWAEAEYKSAADFEAFHSNSGKRKAASSKTSRKKRQTNLSIRPKTSVTGLADCYITVAGPSSQGLATCHDQDDEEELPTAPEPGIIPGLVVEPEPRKTQTLTPPLEGVPHQTVRGIQAIDLTADNDELPQIKTEPRSEAKATQTVLRNEVDLREYNEEDFDFQMRQAEIERDYQLEKATIERRKKAWTRKKMAGGSGA